MDIFACLLAAYLCLFSVTAAENSLRRANNPIIAESGPLDSAVNEEASSSKFQITTHQNTYTAAYPERDAYLGTVSIPDIGFTLDLYWSTAQSVVDQEDAGAMCCFTCLPGDLHGSALIMDHNYQQGKKLGEIGPGVKIYLDLTYGQYIFEAMDTEIAEIAGTEKIVMPPSFLQRRGHEEELGEIFIDTVLSDGKSICKTLVDDSQGDLYIMTCYPLDAVTNTNELFFVRCELAEGTQLVESQNTYS